MADWIKLSLDERRRIETLVNRGISNCQIGLALGRAQPLITQELNRAGGREGYVAEKAHAVAQRNIEKSNENLKKSRYRRANLKERATIVETTTLYDQAMLFKAAIEQLQNLTSKFERLYDSIRTSTYQYPSSNN